MKKGVAYFLGIVTGIILTIIASMLLANKSGKNGIMYFENPEDALSFRSVTVFQALSPGTALARESGHSAFDDQIYLLQLNDKKALYDGETVKAPAGTVFRTIGVYSYETNGGMKRTVPVITIMDRQP